MQVQATPRYQVRSIPTVLSGLGRQVLLLGSPAEKSSPRSKQVSCRLLGTTLALMFANTGVVISGEVQSSKAIFQLVHTERTFKRLPSPANSVSGFLIGLVKSQNTNSAVHDGKQVPLIPYRPKNNLLALFAIGVLNARVSLVVINSFAKAPAAALRLTLSRPPDDDCSSRPCSPRSDASSWNESQMHSIIDQASQTPESAPTGATSPLHQHSAGGSEALQFGPTLGQDNSSRLPDQVSRSMSPFGFFPLAVRATGKMPRLP